MAPKKNRKSNVRHDPRKWALQALEQAGDGVAWPTSKILARASSLSGGKIPYYSIYQALRTLVRRHQLTVKRRGRERVYRLAVPSSGAPAPSAPSAPARVPAVGPVRRAPPSTPAPAEARSSPLAPSPPAGLHKIAPGEIALLHVGDTHIETAANIDGKLVLKRHPRPA
jgi:hypothetical protein